MTREYVAAVAAVALVGATAVRFWALSRLWHRYKIEEIVTVPAANRLIVVQHGAMLVVLASVVVLAYCTGIWWVAIAGLVFAFFGLWKFVLNLRRIAELRHRPSTTHR